MSCGQLPGTIVSACSAPDAMYINEVRFYRTIRGSLSIEAPECFGSIFDETHRSFGVLMEDLTLRGKGGVVAHAPLGRLKAAWQAPLENI